MLCPIAACRIYCLPRLRILTIVPPTYFSLVGSICPEVAPDSPLNDILFPRLRSLMLLSRQTRIPLHAFVHGERDVLQFCCREPFSWLIVSTFSPYLCDYPAREQHPS
jgi:hypothetical protein